jgi:esterase/lipase superfamily enzyme
VPLVRHLNQHDGVGVTGCSFGAYHALVLAMRHPHVIRWCITMGGAFDPTHFLDDYHDADAYFLNPTHFLPNLSDPHLLGQLRRNKWVLVTGEHDICRRATEAMADTLRAKQIPHSLHVWGHGSKHDWPDWRPMAAAYLP